MKKKLNLIIIPSFILFVGIVLALLFNTISISTMSYDHWNKDIISNPQNTLIRGQKITGKFEAKEPHLGMVTFNLRKQNSINYGNSDRLQFKIREINSDKWYYTAEQPIGHKLRSFTIFFGFPIIDDSKGKQYEFELTSLNGNYENSVKLAAFGSLFQSVYKFSPKEITASPFFALKFALKKSMVSFTNINFLTSSAYYIAPAIMYYLVLIATQKSRNYKRRLITVVILLIILDSFFVTSSNTSLTVCLLSIWFLVSLIYNLESSVTYVLAFVTVIVIATLIIFGYQDIQDKISVYLFGLLMIGTIQSICEFKYMGKKKVTFKVIIKDLLNLNEK